MSLRYTGAWLQDGAFNPLTPPTPIYSTSLLYGWGWNNKGQLGLGNITTQYSPKQVGPLSIWISVSSGGYAQTLAVKDDGTLWSWGRNNYGQLGLGNTTDYSSPKQIGALTNWLQVTAGYYHSVAVKTDGTIWGWGYNAYGQIGNGNTTNTSSPNQVGALTNWKQVSGGRNFTLAVKTDGTLWAWGQNNYGQLGQGNTTVQSSPVQVGSLTNWLSATAGPYSSFALKTDGTLWGWARNTQGNIGLGNTTPYSSPKQVGALTNWSKIAAGMQTDGNFSIAVKTNGTLWSWGWNRNGELGLNTTSYYATISSPQQVGALTNWSNVSCGGNHTIALKTDKTLWSWGQNNYGQLGLGNASNYSSPKQIGTLTTWSSTNCGYKTSFSLQT